MDFGETRPSGSESERETGVMEAEGERDDAGVEGKQEKGNKNPFERIVVRQRHTGREVGGSKGKRWMERVRMKRELVVEK